LKLSTVGPCFLALLGTACSSGTVLDVYVRDAHRLRSIGGAGVVLYAERPCSGRTILQSRTDDTGFTRLLARECGDLYLWVWAEGYAPLSRALDTCSTENVAIGLETAPANASPSSPLAATARSFVDAIRAHDAATIARLLADAHDAPLYSNTFTEPNCSLRLLQASEASPPSVDFAEYCLDGCHDRWRVVMTQRDGEWRVQGLERPEP
jgi:hypothetical protein